jgi:hypothetical protein
VLLGGQPFKPTAHVISFLDAICGKSAAALALTTRVGEQDGVALGKEQFGKPAHSLAVVSNTMKQDYSVSVRIGWGREPASKFNSIAGTDGNVLQIRAEASGNGFR